MQIENILEGFKKYHKIYSCFTSWEHILAQNAVYEDFPDWIVRNSTPALLSGPPDVLFPRRNNAVCT